MKAFKFSILTLCSLFSLNTFAETASHVDFYMHGNEVLEAEIGSNLSYFQADEIKIPEGLSVVVYSEKGYEGKQATLNSKSMKLPFKMNSAKIQEDTSAHLNQGHSVKLTGNSCVKLAIDYLPMGLAAEEQTLFADGEKSMYGFGRSSTLYKSFCYEKTNLNLRKMIQDKFGESVEGKEFIVWGEIDPGQMFVFTGEFPENAKGLIKFNDRQMFSNTDVSRIITFNPEDSEVTIGEKN